MLKTVCAAFMMAGGLNLGLVGLFSLDVIAWLCGGAETLAARIVYVLCALAATGFLIISRREKDEH